MEAAKYSSSTSHHGQRKLKTGASKARHPLKTESKNPEVNSPDFSFRDEGSIVLLTPLSPAAHEFVEGEDQCTVARLDEPRRNRKILVAVGLVGPEFRSIRHLTPFTFTILRSFHRPQRLRAY